VLVRPTVGIVLLGLIALSCTAGSEATPTNTAAEGTTATSTTTVPTTTTPPIIAAPEHRIGIRSVDGVAEFFDKVTGEQFVPRGNNYNLLRPVNDPIIGEASLDVTLSTDFYDVEYIENDLAAMEALGYNIVRILPENCAATGCITGLAGGLRGAYMDNMVDFIRRAKGHGIYTWIASNTLPDAGKYIDAAHLRDNEQFSSANSEFLTQVGLDAYADYFGELVSALVERGADLDYVFSFSLRQEHSFDSAAPPLSLESGSVTTANGETYDMSDPGAKLAMVDDGLRHWITKTSSVIKALDPTALVSVGFFAPNEPNVFNEGDTRLVRAVAALDSDADFVDFHVYPTPPFALLEQHVENYQMEGRDDIPIVMGEMAAFTWYTSEEAGAKALHDLEVESCAAGFDGWLTWSWDISVAQPDIWHARTGNGYVGEVLAPANRPDPCESGEFDFFEYSLTEEATVKASRFLPDEPPEAAIDGGRTSWSAGGDAPQYIEIALSADSDVDEIRMTVAQFPEGTTRHEVWVSTTGGPLVRVHVFEGFTTEGDVLTFRPDTPLVDVSAVRVVTTASPSWVAWREISIVAHTPPGD